MNEDARIYFFTVVDAKAKLATIMRLSEQHFSDQKPLVIAVADQAAADFIDQYLWKTPAEGFLPHDIGGQESVSIHIGTPETKAAVLNLRPEPILDPANFPVIYELEDRSNEARHRSSLGKLEAYRQFGASPSRVES